MLTISLWAKRHPRLSQFLIAIFICLQILIAFDAGIRLSVMGVHLGEWVRLAGIFAFGALILRFPSRKKLKQLSWFVQRRYLLIGGQVITWSCFLLVAANSNQMANNGYAFPETGKPFALKVAVYETQKPFGDGAREKGKPILKTWRKNIRELVKARKAELRSQKKLGRGSPEGDSGTIAGYVFLTILLGAVLGTGVCLISCYALGILGIIAAAGSGWMIFLINVAGAKKAFAGASDEKTKKRAALMSIAGWLLILAGLVFGLIATGGSLFSFGL